MDRYELLREYTAKMSCFVETSETPVGKAKMSSVQALRFLGNYKTLHSTVGDTGYLSMQSIQRQGCHAVVGLRKDF